MLDPNDLFEVVEPASPEPRPSRPLVLLHVLSGFVDAGAAARLAADELLGVLDHQVLAVFDVDQLHDYRARRPRMVFEGDRWTVYEPPVLVIHRVLDEVGTPFLLLVGPEPDVQWERFVRAVHLLVRRLGVSLTVGLQAVPMAVPHTRPCGVTAHATRPDLVQGHPPWVNTLEIPGNVSALLEMRLGEAGQDGAGFAAHVPHYLSQAEYPDAAVALLEAVASLTGLRLPTARLREAGVRTQQLIEEQLVAQPEVAGVVRVLEEQYDAFQRRRQEAGTGREGTLDDAGDLPTAEELGAELERFLAEEHRRQGGAEG